MTDRKPPQRLDPEQLSIAYERLLTTLGRLDEHFERDKLAAALHAQWAVSEFLRSDPRVRADDRIRPLVALSYAIMDEAAGATSPLLAPIREKAKAGKRPSLPSLDLLRGGAAAAIEILMTAGMPRLAAGKFVAAELDKRGARGQAGKPVTAVMALRWRDEMGARAPALAQEFYRHLSNKRPPTTLDEAKHIAQQAVRQTVVT